MKPKHYKQRDCHTLRAPAHVVGVSWPAPDGEVVNRIEALDTGESLLGLEVEGTPVYQYIYREADIPTNA